MNIVLLTYWCYMNIEFTGDCLGKIIAVYSGGITNSEKDNEKFTLIKTIET